MKASELSLIALFIYLALLVPVCLKARSSQFQQNASSHYLANRSLGFIVLVMTMYATTFSGNTLLGQTGQAYRMGYLWIMMLGSWMAAVISFHFVVPKLRAVAVANQFITPGDWIRYRFGSQKDKPAIASTLRLVIASTMCIALLNFLFSQIKAGGEIIEVMTEGYIPYKYSIIVFALIILLYDALGGLRAVAWADVIQGVIMLAGFACLLAWLLNNNVGLANLTHNMAQLRPGSVQLPDGDQQIRWLSLSLLAGLSCAIYPQSLQLIFAARNSRTLHRSLACMGLIMLVSDTIVLFTGWIAISLFNIDTGPMADQVLPRLLELWAACSAHGLAALLVILAILAAIMSTADSVLLSLISMLRHDLLKQSNRLGLRYDGHIACIVILPITLLALNRDISLWRLIEVKLEFLLQCFPAFVLALHWQSIKAAAVLAGLISGLSVLGISLLIGIKQWGGMNIGVIALGANLSIMALLHGWRMAIPDRKTLR